ncbi:putative endo-1,3(4)-beta-glucanase [Lachnellula occidentalis]|uniref:glucan endo-1,3-beta-D-glucosidase n=1 Tax=Lachnellula occidentalis TaxID=215460 RepID=A0A8H8S7D2_9HELO|nr:putative endo-1,3(4)-beta-glucanase [Lachnellula occidentalis]
MALHTSVVEASVPVVTTSLASGTAQILPSPTTQTPETSGTVNTRLDSTGAPTSGPIISTSISTPTTTIEIGVATSVTSRVRAGPQSANIFVPVATDAPPSILGQRSDHPVPKLGIRAQTPPIGTNKFYANFFLGSQSAGTWTHPYSVAWSKGGGATKSWGMTIQQLLNSQKVFGPDASDSPVKYFINPIGIQPIVLSAAELGSSTVITNTALTAFSANVNLLAIAGAAPTITFPLVQGMGFVTGIFNGGTPILQSGVLFRSITKAAIAPKPDLSQTGVTKFTIILEDGNTWLIYVSGSEVVGQDSAFDFTVVNNGLIQATSSFNGVIQIARSPSTNAEALYDAAAGAYPTTSTLSGSASGGTSSYTLSFKKGGLANTALLMFALSHHLQSFSSNTTSGVKSNVQLDTTTKGKATAVVGDSWTMLESIPTSMGFGPWRPNNGTPETMSAQAKAALHTVAMSEVSQNMSDQSNLNSMYYSGKALAKFAQILYTLHDILGDTATAQAGLKNLKDAFDRFASNKQQFPLVYDSAWGGLVSTASYGGDSGADFGNTYYNDHHFHYGYFIYAAAIIGYLDPAWLPANTPYVNALVRDIANPSDSDPFFPVSRNFDWYHGHSWAHGLYETFDGKDEESSSKDSMSAYALKMWGRTIGDSNMEARGNLQLAVTARSLQNYFLYTSDNTIEPANFIGNKVSGIMFENKIDHTTYFGANPEFVQGIHMLPLLPSSTLTRATTFVQEEWDAYFSNGRADTVTGGWKGVLFANLAIVDAKTSWEFFAGASFDASWLDGGASRTWYMALAAARFEVMWCCACADERQDSEARHDCRRDGNGWEERCKGTG